MHSWRLITAAAAASTLVACAKPSTQLPAVTQADIQAEQAYQKKYANANTTVTDKDIKFSSAEKKKMGQRVQRLVNQLAPGATSLCYDMHGPQHSLCDMHIAVESKTGTINAFADGKRIVIEPHMIDFATNDTHLAMVIAHEYAHHMMSHVSAAKQNVMAGSLLGIGAEVLAKSMGADTGGKLAQLGAQQGLLSYSPAFEHEADYIAMYMLARSGFDISDGPQFWREMTRNNPRGIYTRTTHPTGPERYVVLNKTIDEINQKRALGLPLLPNRQPQDI